MLQESIFYGEQFKSLLRECIDPSEVKCRRKARTVNPYVFVCILAGAQVWEQRGGRNEPWLWSTAAFSWVSDVRYGDSCQCEYARDRGLCPIQSNTSWSALAWQTSQKGNLNVHPEATWPTLQLLRSEVESFKKCDSASVACKCATRDWDRWRSVLLT